MHKITLLILVLSSLFVEAQQTELSPYSRFGLGNPYNGSFPTQLSMGGSGVALIDGTHLNPLNPASQSFLFGPTFEFALVSQQLKTSSSDASVTNSTTRFNHFAVGFPMWGGKWGASFGLSPVTGVGYNNSQTIYDPVQDETYTAEYIGSGGVNKMFLDIGRRLRVKEDTSRYEQHSFLGLGVGFQYLFGSIASERNSVFPLNSGFISTRIEDATTISDVQRLNGGLLFRHFLDRRESPEDSMFLVFNAGARYSTERDLASKRSRDVFSYVQNAGGIEFQRDSISSFSDREGTVSIPSTISVGTSLEFYKEKRQRKNIWRKYTLTADYTLTDWSTTSEDFGQKLTYDGLGEQSNIALGFAYRPNTSVSRSDRAKHLQLSTYRVGFRTGTSHLDIEGQALEETGISFGLNIPLLIGGIKHSDTQFDFAIEYGTRGTTDAGLLKEDFFRVMVGFSFHPEGYDQWFKKRKYD
jgi:hypothetical protein